MSSPSARVLHGFFASPKSPRSFLKRTDSEEVTHTRKRQEEVTNAWSEEDLNLDTFYLSATDVVNHSKNCDNRRQAVGVICQYVSSKRLRGRSDAEISAKLRGLEMKAGPEFSLVFAKVRSICHLPVQTPISPLIMPEPTPRSVLLDLPMSPLSMRMPRTPNLEEPTRPILIRGRTEDGSSLVSASPTAASLLRDEYLKHRQLKAMDPDSKAARMLLTL